MSHLQTLSELLKLAQLNPESLDKVLEHDRWKTELVLEHELRIEELRQQCLSGSNPSGEYTYSQEDTSFNLLSSYSECNDSQIFKIAKTKVKMGITRLCEDRYEDIYEKVTSDQRYKDIPDRDLKDSKIKSLVNSIIYLSCCSERLKKWPLAKDKNSLLQVQKDFELRYSKVDSITFITVYESVISSWIDLFGPDLSFNATTFDEYVEKSQLTLDLRKKAKEKSDIKTSPLFQKTLVAIPEIDLERLEQYYYSLSGKFVEAGIRTLTLHFTNNRPPELDYTDQYAEWSDIYVNHLHEYKENWKNKLKDLETSTWDEQLKWRKESTS